MNKTNNSRLTRNAQSLRRNMTPEERRLWYNFLKDLPVTVNRQKVIGDYIVDFYCADAKLVIEVDGLQHQSEEGLKNDRLRDALLSELGITVLRYTNSYLGEHFHEVCGDILRHIDRVI